MLNKIIKWTAIDLIGLLACVDDKNKVDQQVEPMISFLSCGNLITVNHAINTLTKIALAKTQFASLIITKLLSIESQNFETVECKNIAIGKTIEAFGNLLHEINNDDRVVAFVNNATKNSRNATKKKAIGLFKKIEKSMMKN